MTNVILWNLDLLVSSISSKHSAAFTLNPRQTSCFHEFFSVIYFLECPCDSLANSQKGLASLGLGENELECHLLNIHWPAMKDFILTLTTVYWKCLLLICLLKKTMSFSGAVPYLTCFSIPVPSLVTGAKIFPRSAYCMNEDKVFAWKSESISRSIMSDSFVIPWTVSCQVPCPWVLQARILEWVAVPFSRGSSWPRDGTQVSWIAGRFFTGSLQITHYSGNHTICNVIWLRWNF